MNRNRQTQQSRLQLEKAAREAPRSPTEQERAICTICAKLESPGFYTGCLIADGHGCGDWHCDGNGNLSRDGAL